MRIPPLAPGVLSDEQSRLYESIAGGPRAQGPQHFALTRDDGSLRGPFNAFLLSPGMGQTVQELGAAIRYRGTLDDRTREIAILLVAARWGSAFEQEAHEAVGRAQGIEEATITALRRQDVAGLAGAERSAADIVIALLDGDLDDAAWQRANDAVGAATIFELTCLVGYYSMLALQLRVFRV